MDIKNGCDFSVLVKMRQDSFGIETDGDYESLQGPTHLLAGVLARVLMVFESKTPKEVRVEAIKELLGSFASFLMQENSEESVCVAEKPMRKASDFILLDPKSASILN